MYDVIIIGAGPAGSTCARECAGSGLGTLILDKDSFPRSKPCAGAVSEQALSHLDFEIPSGIIERECFGARIHFLGRTMDVKKDRRIAVLVSREKFDAFLLNKAQEAGARFIANEKVETVSVDRDFAEVKTATSAFRARYVVGADGVFSRAAQDMRRGFKKNETAAALVCRVPADNEEIDARLGGSLEMHFGIAPMGYGWVFPHDGYYSVGIMGIASEFREPRNALLDYGKSIGMSLKNISGHFIPLGGIKRNIAEGRIILTGDAAGFADPFHGEGIVHAVLSGRLAARALRDILNNVKSGDAGLALYKRECERLIRKNLRSALWIVKLIERYPNILFRIFFHNRGALDKYLDIPLGTIDYRRFLRWLIICAPFYLVSSCKKTAVWNKGKRGGAATAT